MKFALLVTGYKGALFLEKLKLFPDFIVTYDNKEGDGSFCNQIVDWGQRNAVKVYYKKEWENIGKHLEAMDKIFVIGWQFLIKNYINKLVVFHDSYLPERRGRCPTVCALVDGASYLGATTFQPFSSSSEPDHGKIYYRFKHHISYPLSLKNAFGVVVDLYVKMAHNILKENPVPHAIDFSQSSFSMWRDKEDMRIDWSLDSNNIHQKILSLSY